MDNTVLIHNYLMSNKKLGEKVTYDELLNINGVNASNLNYSILILKKHKFLKNSKHKEYILSSNESLKYRPRGTKNIKNNLAQNIGAFIESNTNNTLSNIFMRFENDKAGDLITTLNNMILNGYVIESASGFQTTAKFKNIKNEVMPITFRVNKLEEDMLIIQDKIKFLDHLKHLYDSQKKQ